MEYLDIILAWLNTNWRAIIATFSLCLSVYFARQKIGHKITLSYQVNLGKYSDEQINKLVISNRKDKTISVWSIDAVLENDIKLELFKPDVPLILKSGESISVAPKPYSYLSLDGDRFKPEFLFGKIDFYANLGNKVVKCHDEKVTNSKKNNFRIATKLTVSLDGHLYDESVRFVLIYYFDGKQQLAFFDDKGFIGNEWGRTPNHMGRGDYTAENIKEMLENYGYTQLFSNYVCLENSSHGKDFKLAFKK
ncbi:hypothetical protein [Photobacterium sanguinicancri]|uniref:hypothetical protein n=1 Tax=Photobacterium sanguinicancri TaxID=875932 RepID=UPI00248122E9|nr:hypothetical protein [Photobacterium sanguinicancri]